MSDSETGTGAAGTVERPPASVAQEVSRAAGKVTGQGATWDADRALMRARRFRQIRWAAVPVYTFGYLAFVPFLHLAIVRRRWWDWPVFGAYLAAIILLLTVTPHSDRFAALMLLALVGAVHVLAEFRPGSALAASLDIHYASEADRALMRARRFRQIQWAAVPVYTFGYLAFVPFLHLAIVRRRWWDWPVFGAYLAASILLMALTPHPDRYAAIAPVLALVGAVHVLAEFRPGSALAASRDIYPHSEADRARRVLAWQGAEMVLGRDAQGSPLFAGHPDVAPQHVILRRGEDGACIAEDLGSAAGTFVNGTRITGPVRLYSGDELRLGTSRLRVQGDTAAAAAASVDGVPRQTDAPRGVPGALRIDHAELRPRRRFIGATGGSATPGWLVLTDTGEIQFHTTMPEDTTQSADFSARSPEEFAGKITTLQGVWAQFGETRCFVFLTGERAPERRAAKIEEQADQWGDMAATAGEQLRDWAAGALSGAVSTVGGVVEGLAKSLELVRIARNTKRRASARNTWYPVLLGRQPWPMINAGPVLVLEIPWLAGHPAGSLPTPPRTARKAPDQQDPGQRESDQGAAEPTWMQRYLAQAADLFAAMVGAQWGDEAVARGLSNSCPLRVRWVAADTSLADDWDALVKRADSGASPPSGAWVATPEELADGGHLVKVLSKVPTGRLVVLGEPGAGKTTLALRLVLDLLASRASGAPVPVLASLTSWDPTRRDLHSWLVGHLCDEHPVIGGKAGKVRANVIATLLSQGLILPILDGLDEIPEQDRATAITQINESLGPGAMLVLTSRTDPFRKVVRPPDDGEASVRGAAVIELCPLDAAEVSRCLREDYGGVGASARWDPVLDTLGTQAPAAQALVSPLMASLAGTIYNPRPGERASQLRDPAELCRFDDRAAVEAHLLDAFIPAAYRSRPAPPWRIQQAEKWLAFLARHLETTIASPDLAWWQLMRAAPTARLKLAAALAFGAAASAAAGLITWLAAGPVTGLVALLLFGVTGAAGSAFAARRGKNPRPSQYVDGGFVTVLAVGVVIIVATIFVMRVTLGNWSWPYLANLLLGLVFFCGILPRVSAHALHQLTKPVSPRRVLTRDRWASIDSSFRCGFLIFLLGGVVAGIAIAVELGFTPAGVFALAFPLYLGVYASQDSASLSYELARMWLAAHRRLPRRLMPFLADAHARGILIQTGLVYQFRHVELQHRLATRSAPPRSDGPG